MFKKRIEYVDFDGNKRSEDYYFNLSASELARMSLQMPGGFEGYVRKMIETTDVPELTKLFERLVLMSYGEKSPDGKRFIKGDNNALAKEFRESAAYDKLYMELINDPDKLSEFINKIVPEDLVEKSKSPEVQNKITEMKKEYGLEYNTNTEK